MPILTTLNCTFERKKKNHLNWFARRISVFDFSDSLFWIWIFCFLVMSHKCSRTSSAMVQLNENPHSSHRRWFVFIYIFFVIYSEMLFNFSLRIASNWKYCFTFNSMASRTIVMCVELSPRTNPKWKQKLSAAIFYGVRWFMHVSISSYWN